MKCPQCECPTARVTHLPTSSHKYSLRCCECKLDFTAYRCIKCGTLSERRVCRFCVEQREKRMKKSREERLRKC